MLSYLRDSSQTYYTLHSTWDTVIRLLLHNNLTDYIFRVLTNPVKYGIFMDPHNACLLMDHYLIQKDFSRECHNLKNMSSISYDLKVLSP